jgi:alkanesulfonate monooxygenase SsuD/methylene tetrahydromethanopterin reductase-like flavin-dependent oxidoreductase (luciferase family)
MRIGVSLATALDVGDAHRGALMVVERAGAAAEAGLDVLSIGDHHVQDTPYYQNTPMLGRLLAGWPSERTAGCLFLMPLWHPVLLAEQVGTLAAIHGGTFVVQTGLGGGRRQFAGMGRNEADRLADFREMVPLVRALLAGETVSSERFGISDAVVSPVPPGEVEWWIGAGAAAGIERAARLGATWYAGPACTPQSIGSQVEVYRAAAERHGHLHPEVVIRQDVLVASTDSEADAAAAPVLARGYRGMDPAMLAVGSVDRVVERFAAFATAGVDGIMVRQIAVPQELALASLSLMGDVRRRL